MTAMIEARGLTKRYGKTVALDGLDLTADAGQVVAVLGPNGAGKSTALALLVGLRRPDSGRARLFGSDPRRPVARRDVGVALQESAFPQTLRVQELFTLIRAHYAPPPASWAPFDRLGIPSLARRQLGGLSGGERRRVAVALALAGRPALLVLDEPTAGLDAESRRAVWDAVREQADRGGAVLVTTHQLEEADALATRVLLLEAGRVVADGTVDSIKAAAGLVRVSFRRPPGLVLDGAELEGDRIRLLCDDAGASVACLVRRGVPLADLEVRPLTLEEALTARRRKCPA